MNNKIKVIVSGALGKMGQATLKAVRDDSELLLVGAMDVKASGESTPVGGDILGSELQIKNDLETMIQTGSPDVMVDFTNPQAVFHNARCALQNGVSDSNWHHRTK